MARPGLPRASALWLPWVCFCDLAAAAVLRTGWARGGRDFEDPQGKRMSRIESVFGGGDIVEEGRGLKRGAARCGDSFPAPQRGSTVCPAACPFMRYDPDKVCHWKCITENQCLNAPNMPSSVANKETGRCTICSVVGCGVCQRTALKCDMCKDGFELSDGTCLPMTRHKWRVVYAVIGVGVVALLAYIISIACRPAVNQEVLNQAILYRSNSKFRHDQEQHRLFKLHTNLCNRFIPQAGSGILLHFRFELFALLWASMLCLVMGFVPFWHRRLRAADVLKADPMHDEAYEQCLHLEPEDQIELEQMRIDYVIATAIVYVLSFLGAVIFGITQRRKYVQLDEQTSTMEDFALLCRGFPIEGWGDKQATVEDEYFRFFREAWGDDVLGVSVVWDIGDRTDEILSILGDTTHELEGQHYEERTGRSFSARSRGTSDELETRRGCCHFPDVEATILGLDSDDREDKKALVRSGSSLTEPLTDLNTSGSTFVILRTRRCLDEALRKPLPKFRGAHSISAKHLELDAGTVLWDGFCTSNTERAQNVVRGAGALLAMMVVWTFCFWAPWAYYVMSWSQVRGASQGMGIAGQIQGLLLGLVITAGNQIVYAMCASIAAKCRFFSRDSRDMMNVVLYTVAVSISTVFDLALALLMAHGWQQDTGLDEEALIRNPSMQHALFVQLVAYISPGTILLPFLIEPLVLTIGPFYIFSWLIRSRRDINKWQAEQNLVCPPFDLNRYGDIVINMVLCSLIFFLTSQNVWWMFAQLVISNTVIYVWDHYRCLRASQRTMFATEQMDICGQYLLILPCAILAGALAFKMQGGQAMVRGWDRNEFLSVRVEWIICVAAMLGHGVVHTLILFFVVPRCVREPMVEDAQYEDVAKQLSCNWFNANPVHCLRSIHHFCHAPPHVYDFPGKGHLHRPNPSIHAYYQASEFEVEKGLVSEVKEEMIYAAHQVERNIEDACGGCLHR